MKSAPRAIVTFAVLFAAPLSAQPEQPPAAPFKYLPARAYHILPETHNNESGYFALVDGLDGKMYVGTTKYHENSFLVEFNPETQRQRIVADTNSICGIRDAKGFAAQAKIHTRNFVGPSGVVYFGSMEGYRAQGDETEYPGGYVMTYDPKTGRTENLGIPKAGVSVLDVTADEEHGLIYAVLHSRDGDWMVYDRETRTWRSLETKVVGFCNTLIDAHGRANLITEDSHLAQYDPQTGVVTRRPLLMNGSPLARQFEPAWRLAPDGRSSYLVTISDPMLKRIDLLSEGDVVSVEALGNMIEGPEAWCKVGLDVAKDGRVYAVMRVKNATGFGKSDGHLHHLTRYSPDTGAIEDLGVIVIANPNFMSLETTTYADKFQYLPDGTLAPDVYHFALKCNHATGEVYLTTIYPFALLRLAPIE